jgi:hypothetical protein
MEGLSEVGREQSIGARRFTKGDVDYANTRRLPKSFDQNAILYGNLVCGLFYTLWLISDELVRFMAYTWISSVGKQEEAITTLKAGLEANPSRYVAIPLFNSPF